MSWTCSKCTFINPSSQTSTCLICSSSSSIPQSPSSSSAPSPSTPKWSCKACTFLNPYRNPICEVCGTRASVSSLSCFEDLNCTDPDGELDSSVGSVFLPLQRCSKRKNRDPVEIDAAAGGSGGFGGVKSANKAVVALDLEMDKRMQALGDLIQLHSPDLICFQEVTPNIYDVFQQSCWWKPAGSNVQPFPCKQLSKLPVKSFSCKRFSNSIMGRELCIAELEVQAGKPLVLATSHLESPCPAPPKWDQMYSKERVDQAKEALNLLTKNPNVIFGGDMNWDEKSDGQFPLPDGWVDAWADLRPGENGWTYDTKSNQMLSGNRTLQKRLDRFMCRLHDFKISKIDMIGMEPIPGLSYCKEKKVRKEMQQLVLPVLPSDHYGLLLTISSQ
ncbi:Tyrosyl-DNA phosphodiesterase 2 [Vitis vinifera]|uniref:Tyrosyl-DNA phosphodiesterase 2 n=1 Tax=Vitis vinifera TaxID=29760 RepID=A0A438JGK7_VITVI|nr:Tyrosyl-DNA phosphodiesterase 2 [Vitis vinifera]